MYDYCISLECNGELDTWSRIPGWICSPRPLDSGPDPSFKAWMSQVVSTVLDTGDRVFDEWIGRRCGTAALARPQ